MSSELADLRARRNKALKASSCYKQFQNDNDYLRRSRVADNDRSKACKASITTKDDEVMCDMYDVQRREHSKN